MNTHSIVPDLKYNIVECLLTGRIDSLSINALAGSGGRAETKTKNALNYWLANNPYATHIKLSKKNPGGPLPMGFYKLKLHEKYPDKSMIRLLPFSSNAMQGRAGFLIHGRGPRGSDGCIVPTDFNLVLDICKALKKREAASGAAPVMEVFALGDLSRWDSMV